MLKEIVFGLAIYYSMIFLVFCIKFAICGIRHIPAHIGYHKYILPSVLWAIFYYLK